MNGDVDFHVENKGKDLSNGNIFQSPPVEILSYFALKGPSSLIAEQSAEAAMCRDYCQPLRSPVILSFALGKMEKKIVINSTGSDLFFETYIGDSYLR